MTEMLISIGSEANLIEYFDENGVFHQNNWSGEDGHIRRSLKHDERNKMVNLITQVLSLMP